MYDWPELRPGNDAAWAGIRDRLRAAGVDAPERLSRDRTDLHALWRDPGLLLSQTCWGPMEAGLAPHVQVVAQPDYSSYEGGRGELYSSAIVMRALPSSLWEGQARSAGVGVDFIDSPPPPPESGPPRKAGKVLPLHRLRHARFAFNSRDSRSGYLALKADLEAAGEGLAIFSHLLETGGHRASIRAVAEGEADVAAIDCKSWALALRHEPAARELAVAGWTGLRKGLPYVTARGTPGHVVDALRAALAACPPP